MPTTATATGPARQNTERLTTRVIPAIAGVLLVLGLATVTAPDASLLLALPAALTVFTVGVLAAGWPRTRRSVGSAAGAVSLISLAGTSIWFARSAPTPAGGLWPLLHTAALTILAALVCRWSPPRHALTAGSLTVLAEAVLILPIAGESPPSWWDTVASCMFWSLAGLVGAGSGAYLRRLDARRVEAVRAARRAQRVQLATDLHDFVAHDVSAMVIQAQAAQALLGGDPGEVARVLRRIESDGTRALAAMDRTIRMLRELEHGTGPSASSPAVPLPGVADLPELARRYAMPGAGPIRFRIEPGLDTALHPEAGTTVYRVVVEALTNVRRHAPARSAVTVDLSRSAGGGAVLTVTDQTPSPDRQPATARAPHGFAVQRRGGAGLAGLTERVQALGGTFTAGRVPPAGWQVRAELPAELLEPAP